MQTERRVEQLEDFTRLENEVSKVKEEVTRLADKLTSDHTGHHEYIRKALEREARKEALHNAIIEKTMIALVWSALVGLGTILYSSFTGHWH